MSKKDGNVKEWKIPNDIVKVALGPLHIRILYYGEFCIALYEVFVVWTMVTVVYSTNYMSVFLSHQKFATDKPSPFRLRFISSKLPLTSDFGSYICQIYTY